MLAEFFQYREDFPAGALHVIVDHHVLSNPLASRHLFGGARESGRDVIVTVTSTTKSLFEMFHGRRDDEKNDRRRGERQDMFGAM